MKHFDNKYLIELIGIFGIIASLLFVGAQLILDRRIASSTAYHGRVALRMDDLIGQRDNSELVQARAVQFEKVKPFWWNDEIESYVAELELTMEDVVRLDLQARIYLALTDNNFYQYGVGLIDDESWAGMRTGFSFNLTRPISKSAVLRADYLRPAMLKMIDDLAADMEIHN